MDETHIKVKGQRKYLYRALDKDGNTVDFLLRARRNRLAARRYFETSIAHHGVPETVTRTRPMLGFKKFGCTRILLSGIELMHMRVRFLTLPFSRKVSRRRMAGGELRLGTVADVHAYYLSHIPLSSPSIFQYYMTTCILPKRT
jgi:transposase-like protein